METGEQLRGSYNSLTQGNRGPKPEEVVGTEKEVVVGVDRKKCQRQYQDKPADYW